MFWELNSIITSLERLKAGASPEERKRLWESSVEAAAVKRPTLRLRGMGSSNSRLLPSCSSRLGSSGPAGTAPPPPAPEPRKGLKVSADSGGDGVEGLD